MAVIGVIGGFGLLLPALFMQVLYQGGLVSRIPQAAVGIRFASVPAGAATGFVIGAVALGGFLGGLIGGFAANQWGFNSVNWMGGIAGVAAVVLILVALLPASRERVSTAPAPEGATSAQVHHHI
jgi:predicted MFS family arabinose efflux permease